MPPFGLAPLWEILDPPLLWEIVDLPLNNEQLNRLVKIMFQDISENFRNIHQQVEFQSNANHPLAESMGYIKFEGM